MSVGGWFDSGQWRNNQTKINAETPVLKLPTTGSHQYQFSLRGNRDPGWGDKARRLRITFTRFWNGSNGLFAALKKIEYCGFSRSDCWIRVVHFPRHALSAGLILLGFVYNYFCHFCVICEPWFYDFLIQLVKHSWWFLLFASGKVIVLCKRPI